MSSDPHLSAKNSLHALFYIDSRIAGATEEICNTTLVALWRELHNPTMNCTVGSFIRVRPCSGKTVDANIAAIVNSARATEVVETA